MTDRDMGKALHIVPSKFNTIEPFSHAAFEFIYEKFERQIVHNRHFASNNLV